jgi:RNA polymerase sigma-70 factor (ECF subfamily)
MGAVQSPAHAAFWLRKVAVQRSIDASRRRMRRPQLALDDIAEPATRPSPGDPLLSELLRKLIATLPESPRMAMVLRYQEDLAPAEIADVMGSRWVR